MQSIDTGVRKAFGIGKSITENFRQGQRERLQSVFSTSLEDFTPEEVSFLIEVLEMRDNLGSSGRAIERSMGIMPLLAAMGVDCEKARRAA